ncbi:TPA: hypothetical protein ACH1TP_002033 [Enterobacter roggenkampii]
MALTLLAANNAQTVLAAGISASATSLTVNSGTGSLFPAPSAGVSFFKLTLIDAATGQLTEIMHVTARTGDTMTIERGQEGTTARAWSANDIAANMMTAGTLSYLLTNFQPLDPTLTAIAALVGAANKLPYFNGPDTAALTDLTAVGRDIIGQSSIANLLTYLGLGEAAKRGVGTGANQLPDMSSFAASLSGNGWQKLPSGLIIQWAQILSNSGGFAPWTYPIAFPNACLQAYASAFVGVTANNFTLTMIGNPGTTAVTAACYVNGVQSSTAGQVGVRYLAIGY